ncbi:unnamed protein product [Schistosoma bovis]|nr:unnamed protein product [Schistosoma bovis]
MRNYRTVILPNSFVLVSIGRGRVSNSSRQLSFTPNRSLDLKLLIIMIIGVGLLNSPTTGYEIVISVTVDTTLASLAILLGVKLRVPERKLKIILFSLWCVFGGIGLILLIVGAALHNYIVLGVSWICWCCIMLIVIVYTAYYLCGSSEEEQSHVIYILFLWSYEYTALIISSQFCLNSFIDCHPCNKTMNNTMIGHYE